MAAVRHTIIALVEDKPGVLNRMVSLFRRRGFNIESLAVGTSEQPHLSRMTIVVAGPPTILEQVRKQLEKIVDVVKVSDISAEDTLARELALIKVRATTATRGEIIQLVDVFKATILDAATDSLTVEVTGDEERIDSLFNLLCGFGIKEMNRTGRIATTRGTKGVAAIRKKPVRAQSGKSRKP